MYSFVDRRVAGASLPRTSWPACGFTGRFLILATCLVCWAAPALASHFRFAHISWRSRTDIAATAVELTVTTASRRDGYAGTHADGYPRTGDVVLETIGASRLEFGDGTETGTLSIQVTAFSPEQNWFVGQSIIQHAAAG